MIHVESLADGRLSFVVKLLPRSSRTEVVGWSTAGQLTIRLTAPPVGGAANRQLIEYLAKLLDTRKSSVTIASGERSRTKRLLVPPDCKNRLLSLNDIC
jgi:uncharacterized protein (TIGR00251 family)